MAAAKRLPDFLSLPVAFLVLLARAAPARIVATELLLLAPDDLLRVDRLRGSCDAACGCDRAAAGGQARHRDRVLAGDGFMLVREAAVAAGLLLLEHLRILGRELRVEERADDLFADHGAELLEHPVALAAVLDEWILLRERAQMHALAEVVHVLEVLAPARVDDLERHEALELAHQVGPELLLLLLVLDLSRVLQLLEDRIARAEIDALLAELAERHVGAREIADRLQQRFEVPFLRVFGLQVRVDRVFDHLVDPALHFLRPVLAFEDAAALRVDHLALRVHDVVVLKDVLAHDEVLLLDLLLRVLDLAREDRRLHRLVVGHLEALHDVLDPVAGEEAHEFVFAREIEARLACVALAARAATELVVDPARLVAFGAEHVETARFEHALAELDVDAAAGHVRRDRDRAELARILDDLRLALVLLRVQDGVRDALALEQFGEILGGLDRDCAEQDGLPRGVALLDVADHRLELALLRAEDVIVLVEAGNVLVRGDLDDVEVVDLDELLLLCLRGAGHAGELLVEAEVVLERDRRKRDVLLLDREALFRLDGLVQALAPAPAFHDPAGELVDDLDLALLDDVIDVALIERLRLERLREVVDELRVPRVVEVLDPKRALDLLDRRLARRDGLELLVVDVVGAAGERVLALQERVRLRALELLHDAGEVVVGLRCGLRLAGDDQRRTRLVDQDRVDLVHDRVAVAALHELVERDRHVVAEVVEAELGVRPVRDVAGVGLLALGERHHVLDEADAHAELLVDRARPLGVALGKVVVHRDEVDALPLERVQVERLDRDEGLALTGLHLGDVAFVERDPAHQLHVEEADADRALERLADGRVALEEELLERLAVLEPLLELGGLGGEFVVRERLELGFEGADVRRLVLKALEPAALAEAEDLFEGAEVLGHERPRVAGRIRLSGPGPGSVCSRDRALGVLARLFVQALERLQQMAACGPLVRAGAGDLAIPEVLCGDAHVGLRLPELLGHVVEELRRLVKRIAHRGASLTSQSSPSRRSAWMTYAARSRPSASSDGTVPKVRMPSTRRLRSPPRTASSIASPAISSVTLATWIPEAPTAQSSSPRRLPSARYGGWTCSSTASASGASSPSGTSSSTISVPSGSAVKWTSSPGSCASAVTTASQRLGRGTPCRPPVPLVTFPSRSGGCAR